MDINIFPVQPAANRKNTPDKYSRGKRGSPGNFSQVLGRLSATRSTQDRQDGFGGEQPHHRDTREELEDMLQRIHQVNREITIRWL